MITITINNDTYIFMTRSKNKNSNYENMIIPTITIMLIFNNENEIHRNSKNNVKNTYSYYHQFIRILINIMIISKNAK